MVSRITRLKKTLRFVQQKQTYISRFGACAYTTNWSNVKKLKQRRMKSDNASSDGEEVAKMDDDMDAVNGPSQSWDDPPGTSARLVLLRHGESEWNASKRFTGWVDVDLSERGRDEAIHAGLMLKRHGFEFDEAHTSVLKRAVRTLWSVLHSCDQHWIDVKRTWRLNERHYGALQGLSKAEVKRQMGEELLQRFRRGFDQPPIPMREDHPFWTGRDRRYRTIGPDRHPTGESLRMCQQRVMPYWQDAIVPSLRRGQRILVSAHNNVLRCLVQYMDQVPVDQIRKIEIPTAVPIVYHLDQDLTPIGEPDEIGFRGKFLVDAEARDAEYVADIEFQEQQKLRFSQHIDPVDAMKKEDIRSQCEVHGLALPKAWQ